MMKRNYCKKCNTLAGVIEEFENLESGNIYEGLFIKRIRGAKDELIKKGNTEIKISFGFCLTLITNYLFSDEIIELRNLDESIDISIQNLQLTTIFHFCLYGITDIDINNKEFAKEQDHAANAYKCVGEVLCTSSAAKIHEEKKISSKSVSGGLIFEYIFNPLLISLNWLLAWLVRFLTYCCNAMMSVAFDMPSALLDTWAILRTFANVLFVGLLVAFASMVIIGAKKDTYSLKVFAPNFLIAVILVNFSWVINMMVLENLPNQKILPPQPFYS